LSAATDSTFRIEVQTNIKPNTISGVGSIVALGLQFNGDLITFDLDFVDTDRATAKLNGIPIISDSVSPHGNFLILFSRFAQHSQE
jgi:hypothetical protein